MLCQISKYLTEAETVSDLARYKLPWFTLPLLYDPPILYLSITPVYHTHSIRPEMCYHNRHRLLMTGNDGNVVNQQYIAMETSDVSHLLSQHHIRLLHRQSGLSPTVSWGIGMGHSHQRGHNQHCQARSKNTRVKNGGTSKMHNKGA